MADVEFRNWADVKWHTNFDSSIIQSQANAITSVTSELTLGTAEVLESTTNIMSVTAGILILGTTEQISGTVSCISNISAIVDVDDELSGTAICQTSTVCILCLGIVEHLSSTCDVESYSTATWLYVPGEMEYLTSTILCQSSVVGVMLTEKEVLSGTLNVVSRTGYFSIHGYYVVDLTIGVIEILGTSSITTTGTASTLTIGEEVMVSGTASCESTSVSTLNIGEPEVLSGSSNFEVVTISSLLIGVIELLVSIQAATVSTPPAVLTIGEITEDLVGTSSVESVIAGFLQIPGVLELLSSTVSVISAFNTTGLIIGVQELAAADIAVTSFATSTTITVGSLEELSGTSSCQTDAVTSLALGVVELIAGVQISTVSIPPAALSIDHILSSATNSFTTISASLIVGQIVEELSGTSSCECNVTSWLLVGLSSTSSTTSSVLATLTIGFITLLEVHCLTISDVSDSMMDLEISLVGPSYYDPPILNSYARSSMEDAELIVEYARVLSATVPVITDVSGNIISGSVELLVGTSVVNSDFVSELGLAIVLSSSSTLSTNVEAALITGIVTTLVSQCLITSDATVTYLTNIVIVSGSTSVVSEVNNTVGITSGKLIGTSISESSVWAFTITGVAEDLHSTSYIQSNVSTTGLIIGVTELNGLSTIVLVTTPVLGGNYLVSSSTSLVSKVTVTELTLGWIEILSTAQIVTSNTAGLLVISADEHLSGTVSTESVVSGFIIKGVITPLFGEIVTQSGVSTTGLILNVEELFATCSPELVVTGTISFIAEEVLEGITVVQSNVPTIPNIMFIVGHVEFMWGTTTYGSSITANLTLLGEEVLVGNAIVNSNVITPFLTVGITEVLSSSVSTQSDVCGESLIVGLEELLSSSSILTSSFPLVQLTLGITEVASGVISFESNCSGTTLILGITEVLTSTSSNNIDVVGELSLGISEALTGTLAGSSQTTADLTTGLAEIFLGTISIQSKVIGECITGIPAPLTSTLSTISNVDGNLHIGVYEQISAQHLASVYIASVELSIGAAQALESTDNVISTVSSSFLTIGVTESLRSTAGSTTTAYTTTLVFGVAELFSAIINVVSDVEATPTLGIIEDVSSSITVMSNVSTVAIVVGIIEQITTTSFSESIVNGFIDVGVAEGLTGSVGVTSIIVDLPISLMIETNSSISIISNVSIPELIIGIVEDLTAIINVVVSILDPGMNITCIAEVAVQSTIVAHLTFGIEVEQLTGATSFGSTSQASTLDIDIVLGRRNSTYDLQYWFSQYVINSNLNKNQIPFLSKDHVYFEHNSFIELLFNDDYLETDYRYLYREETNKLAWPSVVRDRLMIRPSSAKYFVCDSDNTDVCNVNLYSLLADDIITLDRLLVYRLEPENATLVGLDYDSLNTNLSKMIYMYLDLKIYGDYSRVDHQSLMSGAADLLEQCYEAYLIENVFNIVSAKGA